MAFDKGFNFRGTSGFVTDGTNETFVLGDLYPTTRNGVTFGWDAAPSEAVDRNATVDRRLAGQNLKVNSATSVLTLRVDLPATGNYILTLALGDASFEQNNQKLVFKDNTTTLATIGETHTFAGEFIDATGVVRLAANWPTQNLTITKTFASTILNVVIGSATVDGTGTSIAHLFVSQVAAADPLQGAFMVS